MLYDTIKKLKQSSLLELSWLISQREKRQENEHLLQKIVGFITVYNVRPPITTVLDLLKLPRPKEIAVIDNRKGENKETIIVDSNYVKVTTMIYRSTLDDSYVFNFNENCSHYLIVLGGKPNELLQQETNKIVHQFSLTAEFPKAVWSELKIKRTPTHFARSKTKCVFYGKHWSVTVTFCPDNVSRITAWTGINTAVPWDTGQPFVITTNTPALVLTPKRAKHSFSCDIEEVERFV